MKKTIAIGILSIVFGCKKIEQQTKDLEELKALVKVLLEKK